MVKVSRAKAYSIQTDEEKAVWGTLEFLAAAQLEPIEGTERDVPDSEVDGNGEYRPHA